MPLEGDLTAVHELDLPVAREALPFAGVHEVPPSAAGGQPGRDVVVAALVRQRNTEQKPTKPTNNLQGWPIFPHAIFIPGDQFIQISHDVIILWIDFSHYI